MERQDRDKNAENDNVVWEYYIVDHSSHHLLWLTEHIITTNNYKGAESEAHIGKFALFLQAFASSPTDENPIGQLLRYEYYIHLSYFPHEQILEDDFFTEMKGILVWGLAGEL